MIKLLLFVFVGGGLGSVARYLISLLVPSNTFPWATLTANVISSLILGMVMGYLIAQGGLHERWRLFLAVGFCGGFSTFSTFSYETMDLFLRQDISGGLLNILVSVVVCLFCIYLGMKLIALL